MREFRLPPVPEETPSEPNFRRFVVGLDAVKGVRIHKQDLEIVRAKPSNLEANLPGFHERGKVTEFTFKSRQRLAFVAANTLAVFRSMATLTYPAEFPSDGATVKGHLDAILAAIRRKTRSGYLWFLEFQRRGAPHFHLLLEFPLPAPIVKIRRDSGSVWETNKALDDWLAERWYEIVGSGDLNHWRCGTSWETIRSKDGGARYAVKYAYKIEQKTVPEEYSNVGRLWGHSRAIKPPPRPLIVTTPEKIRACLEAHDKAPESFKFVFGGAARWIDAGIDLPGNEKPAIGIHGQGDSDTTDS